jgi:hypothetical protein
MELERLKLNYIVNLLMFICFLIYAVSGIFFLFFPEGRRSGWYQIGVWHRGDLNNLHTIFVILTILFVAIHFLLHLKWIIATTKIFLKEKKR